MRLFLREFRTSPPWELLYADDLVKYFGVDAVRYFSLHEMPFAQDGTITWDLVMERINSDLANILGNLVQRTITMVNKYFDGVVPAPGSNVTIPLEKHVTLNSDFDGDILFLEGTLTISAKSSKYDSIIEIFAT